jgi:hypothetical protein
MGQCGRQRRSVRRTERARWSGVHLDSDDGQGALPLTPALGPGGGALDQSDLRGSTSVFDPKLTLTMPSLPKYSVRHEESVCNSRATHS